MFDVISPDLRKVATDLERATVTVPVESRALIAKSTQATHRDAKNGAPVLTGYLQDHIDLKVDGLSGEVISAADYSEYVEDGTSVMAPEPFMGPALTRNTPGLVAGFEHIGGSVL